MNEATSFLATTSINTSDKSTDRNKRYFHEYFV